MFLHRRWILDNRRTVNVSQILRPHRCLPEREPQPVLCFFHSGSLNNRRAKEEIGIAVQNGIAKRDRTPERNVHGQRLADQLAAARSNFELDNQRQFLRKDGKLIPMPVQIGDKILMDKYCGQEVTLNDEEFVIVKAEDIVAIIN